MLIMNINILPNGISPYTRACFDDLEITCQYFSTA